MSEIAIHARIQGADRILRAFRRFPAVMERRLELGGERASQEVAREERRVAPKAFSTLVNSIRVSRETGLRWLIAPAVNYAAAVERGTGPGANPDPRALEDWIRLKRIEPINPEDDIDDLVFLIGRKIRTQGTRAQPFVEPTAQKMTPRVRQIVQRELEAGLREVGLA